jgi:A/G-specific adenine glycosylase
VKSRKYSSAEIIHPSRIQNLQVKLLAWYRDSRRDLPWRNLKDPYRVWISEVMLQQTQVQTVVPYYLRFLEHFPDLAALASSKTEDLLRIWAGLGYYSRARNLRRAAQELVERFGGEFPKNYEDVLSLPGIGHYTAAAILSIAFDQPYAVLDGNVARVLARLFAIEGDPKDTRVRQSLWKAAQTLLASERPGDFNQALMELGATICSPRRPHCLLCPWRVECVAREEGRQEMLPEKTRRALTRKSHQVAIVVRHRGRYFIVRRAGQRLLQDFWEFPSAELDRTENLPASLTRWIHQRYGLVVSELQPLLTIKYSITVRRIELAVFQGILDQHPCLYGKKQNARWIRLSEANLYPFASAARQIVDALRTRNDSHIRT